MKKIKILVIGPSWLGDMVMAQSLFKLLKEKQDCDIDVMAPSWSLDVVRKMPEVRNTIALDIKHGELSILKRYRIGKELRNTYDQAITLPNSWKSALIPFFAKIPKRTGWVGEIRYGLLNDARKLDKNAYPLMVQRYAALALDKKEILKSPPHPKLSSKASIEEIRNKFKLSVSDKDPIILCPGAAFGSAKRWPLEYYATIAKHAINKDRQVWLLGSKADKRITDVIEKIISNPNCVNFAGQLNLMETVDIISISKAMVTNDSGLMHVASALDIPTVTIYGPTSSEHTPPLGNHSAILERSLPCRPCFKRECPLKHHRCMQEITPNMVIEKLNELEKIKAVA